MGSLGTFFAYFCRVFYQFFLVVMVTDHIYVASRAYFFSWIGGWTLLAAASVCVWL